MILLVLFAIALAFPTRGQGASSVVYLVSVDGMIDLGLAPFVERILDEAIGAEAQAVILEINTFGGRVDAAVQIRDALLRARVPTVAGASPWWVHWGMLYRSPGSPAAAVTASTCRRWASPSTPK